MATTNSSAEQTVIPQGDTSAPAMGEDPRPPSDPPRPLSSGDKNGLDPMNTSTTSIASHKGKGFTQRSRTDLVHQHKEREERVKRIREQQEDERRKKLEELREHAIAAQKFREQREMERRKHMEEMRFRDQDRWTQVQERRKAIEQAERERKEAMLMKYKEREERLEIKRRQQQSQINFAFGSSTPRMMEPRVDSTSDIWGARRSTSTTNVHAQLMTQSMYTPSPNPRRSAEREPNPSQKRSTSATGLNKSTDGEDLMTQSMTTAHRRRTDLVPTVVTPSGHHPMHSRASTPGMRTPGRTVSLSRLSDMHAASAPKARHQKRTPATARNPQRKSMSMNHLNKMAAAYPGNRKRNSEAGHTPRPTKLYNGTDQQAGLSREGTQHSRPNSVMSSQSGAVRMRTTPSRRPRPSSIATTGIMSASMFERRTPKMASTPTSEDSRKKRSRSQLSDKDDDTKSTSSTASASKPRKTVKDVKRDAEARKKSTPSKPTPKKDPPAKDPPPKPAFDQPDVTDTSAAIDAPNDDEETDRPRREVTPDIIKEKKTRTPEEESKESTPISKESTPAPKEPTPAPISKESTPAPESGDAPGDAPAAPETPAKKIITSEEEAKARIAQKRKEMREKKEREEELERQRQAELARQEEERRLREEEEERKAMEEAERLAAEARKLEEERLAKAIEEAAKKEEEERLKREEEERLKKEKEESDRKAQEEAERKQAELAEKLKKEEEERAARKKRIEEIMARTRGGKATPNTTPKKEAPPASDDSSSSSGPPPIHNHSNNSATPDAETRLQEDPVVDPTKPDLIDGLNSLESKNNLRNNQASPGVEKGAVDAEIAESQPSKEPLASNGSSSLIDFDPLSLKTPEVTTSEAATASGDLEILDLASEAATNGQEVPSAKPIIAFEDSITSTKQEPPTADLLS